MIYPYKQGSNSAKLLGEALKFKRIRLEGSSFRGGKSKFVINWGASSVSDEVNKCIVLNEPEAVAVASNKRLFFEAVVGEVNIPEFTTDNTVAKSWIEEGKIVIVREKLTGHSAEGLVVLEDVDAWDTYNHNNSKLYVKYIPKKDEFRVHVVCGKVVDVRRKSLRSDFNAHYANWKVRNHANGFIFAKGGFEVPDKVLEESVKATMVCGLDFGAVDVVWNNFLQKAFVLEINTAPGLEGSTVDSYANGFKAVLEDEIAAEEYKNRKTLLKSGSLNEEYAAHPAFFSSVPMPAYVLQDEDDAMMEASDEF